MNRPVPDLSCKELVQLVTDYLEDHLPEFDRVRFELHLAYCDWCRTYLAQMREVVSTAGKLTDEVVAPAARDALLAVYRDWKKGSGGP